MQRIVNAKVNIGLQIVRRREDGYHELRTVFCPVGLYAGTPENPEPFCDMLEVLPRAEAGFEVELMGRKVECPLEKNLVYRAAEKYFTELATPGFGARVVLEKHLPDGAGCGGGSADAAMTLEQLSALDSAMNGDRGDFRPRDKARLRELALQLGADCPFFLENCPAYACGIGEILEPIELDLKERWMVLVKPDVYISTREAFAGVTPHEPDFDLRRLPGIPIEEWRAVVHNDFEDSIFPQHPELRAIKERLYWAGALYASMTGSGSSVYGIYENEVRAREAYAEMSDVSTFEGAYLLKM